MAAADMKDMSLETLLDIQPVEEEISERLTQIAEYLVDKQKISIASLLRKTQIDFR